jgi:hypothetical protein
LFGVLPRPVHDHQEIGNVGSLFETQGLESSSNFGQQFFWQMCF